MTSYEDFLIDYGSEIVQAKVTIKKMSKLIEQKNKDNNEIEEEELFANLEEYMEKKLKYYDKLNSEAVISWFLSGDVETRDIVDIGLLISNRYGTEIHMVLDAIGDGENAINSFFQEY